MFKRELFYDKWLQSSIAGLGEQHRQLEKKWNEKNIWKNAPDMDSMFHGFKHKIIVDWRKILEGNKRNGWMAISEFRDQFYYPNRELGDHAICMTLRGAFPENGGAFEFMEVGATDICVVATNNDADATYIALKYS